VISSDHPLAGLWVLNPARSTAPPSPQVHDGVMLEFGVTGHTITMTQVVVDPSGHDIAIKLAMRTDGSGQPVRFGKGLILETRLDESQRLEAVIKMGKDIVSQGVYEVSSDKQKLAFVSSAARLVFDRVGAR